MTNVLKIDSSIYAGNGQSSQLATQFIDALRERNADLRVIERDVVSQPLPHLDAARFQAFLTKPEERTAEQRAVTDVSDALIDELKAADVIVLGLPMYNFSVPSQLKAYFDHVARAGITFKYTEKGPVGLLTGKKAYVFATRGGQYAGTPNDTETSYVRQFLAFLGISNVEFVYAEGLAYGDASKTAAVAQARRTLQTLASPVQLAA
jgi:FMN-dependent NADH-azoreductase